MPTVDIPAYLSDAPFSPGWTSTDISTPDTATEILMRSGAASTGIASFGLGPNRFNWDMPDGAVVTSVRYVAIAYREETGPVNPLFVGTGWDTPPTESPWMYLDHNVRTPDLVFDAIPVGGYAGETVCGFAEDIAELTGSDFPYNRAWYAATDADVHWLHLAYLAIRITYTTSGQPPLRLRQRGDSKAGGAERSRGRGRASGNRVRGHIR